MKKRILSVILAAAMMIMAVGCGSGGSAATETTGGDAAQATEEAADKTETTATVTDNSEVKIGVSMATTQSTFYAKVAQLIEDHCKEIGVECMLSDEDYDLNKQISSIENFISAKCTAIILVVFDEEGIKDTVQKAVDEGIYVLTYDGYVEGAQGSLNVDNYEYGYLTGTMAADWINSNPELKDQEEIQVGIFDYPEIPVIIDRADGIEDALKEKAPNAKVVARQSAAIADEGVTLGENFMQAYPDMQIICGINDNGVVGAYEVWSAEGRVGDNIGFFGADADEKALELISQGTSYRGTVALTAETSVPAAVDVCVAASKGEEVDGNIIFDMAVITADNVADYLK
ncbi:sugar ABC transporter substrate-binding protein [Clostridiaceae bacterium Marseille-Q4145]|jgi:ribose transport system substrate-binding protein|nr:sugar ABC transporter substrate-binding protein [Clostridiaceae bacterium Marseille-Q4145]